MPTYNLDLDSREATEKKGGLGCLIGGWGIFLLVAATVLFIGYRTWFYYQKIKTGQLVDLPQFTNHLTSVGGKVGVNAITLATRTDVESETAAADGASQQDAKLVIVEFADFQCPYSKEEALVARSLMQKYGDKIRFEYRDLPLEELHPFAMQASIAARCAQEQGKFWAYHDKLYVNSPALTDQLLAQFAVETGLDAQQFSRCFSSRRYQGAIDADKATAQRLGITGTPTFFLNGNRIEGAVPSDVFEDLIQKMTK